MDTLLVARLSLNYADMVGAVIGAIILTVVLIWLSGIVCSKPRRYCAKHERMCCSEFNPKDRYFIPPM